MAHPSPVSETRADWVEVLTDTPAPDTHHIFSPAVGKLVCERIASGETLNKIASEPGMPSRSTRNGKIDPGDNDPPPPRLR